MARINALADYLQKKHVESFYTVAALRKLKREDPNNTGASLDAQSAKLSGGVTSAQTAIAKTIIANRPENNRNVPPSTTVPTPNTKINPGSNAIILRTYTKTTKIGGEQVIIKVTVWVYPNSGKQFTTEEIIG